MDRRRGTHQRPLLDEHREPTTRMELESAERLGDTGWAEARPRARPAADPALVAMVARLQAGGGFGG